MGKKRIWVFRILAILSISYWAQNFYHFGILNQLTPVYSLSYLGTPIAGFLDFVFAIFFIFTQYALIFLLPFWFVWEGWFKGRASD